MAQLDSIEKGILESYLECLVDMFWIFKTVLLAAYNFNFMRFYMQEMRYERNSM